MLLGSFGLPGCAEAVAVSPNIKQTTDKSTRTGRRIVTHLRFPDSRSFLTGRNGAGRPSSAAYTHKDPTGVRR